MLHLRYFVAVAEELNFSAAARRLHMATSPLSQRIRDLERELGQQLFDRDTRSVTLTPVGSALLPIARDVLDEFSSIPWRLREATREQRDTVLIGIPPGLHPELRSRVGTLTERVQEQFELQRWPGSTQALVAGVREGRIGLALARLPFSDPALEQASVMSERMGAAVPADMFAGRDSVALADLADLPYVAPPKEVRVAYFDVLERALAEGGVRHRLCLTDTGYNGVSEVISSGLAFCISILAPENPIHGYQLENVTVLPFTDFHPRLETALVWRRDRADSDLKDLVAAAREIFDGPMIID
ncbi:LysR family transcriptional regulator [Streptomyces gibsoniae]|uniref:LysR family transcriptional regulator n=1 Tax=Streptomyces gibsoniae TaxID=3075529 RepID=A0ABU2U2I0_9ACTN|nr:LysR family transcriptional regulator [Streptomyces sp. DSM 41699]MDT0467310.1 LysR family transcriptional regulator [Streptomyces sp. DSM 41699]